MSMVRGYGAAARRSLLLSLAYQVFLEGRMSDKYQVVGNIVDQIFRESDLRG